MTTAEEWALVGFLLFFGLVVPIMLRFVKPPWCQDPKKIRKQNEELQKRKKRNG